MRYWKKELQKIDAQLNDPRLSHLKEMLERERFVIQSLYVFYATLIVAIIGLILSIPPQYKTHFINIFKKNRND